MAREWTAAQTAAMTTGGCTLLVSAAAGSGKTATLTERIIRRLTDPVHPAELSRMLIVTFTRAAAAELKQRISEALRQALDTDPYNRHLQRQILDLGSAHISTIDAFCMEPLRAHFAEAGLPADFRMADEAELLPLSERIMDELIDEFYKSYAPDIGSNSTLFALLEDNPFADLCDALTPTRSDDALPSVLRGLYQDLLTFPDGLIRLKTEAERLREQAGGDFLDSDHGAILREWKNDLCASMTAFFQEAVDILHTDAKAEKAYGPSFAYDLAFAKALTEADTYPAVRSLLLSYAPVGLKALRGAVEVFTRLKARRAAYVEAIRTKFTGEKGYFRDEPEAVARDMRETARMCEVLYEFLTAYDTRMTSEKSRRGICDFTDNRRNLLRMLENPDGSPSPLALEYRKNFDEVYIDEYQDVDEVQDRIFRLVGGDHRFMVGDIKQSIYAFRGADPSVFAAYRRSMPLLAVGQTEGEAESGNTSGYCIFMSENFRCDRPVIQVTNGVCGHLFSACPASVAYRPQDDLVFAKRPPSTEYVSPLVQIDLVYRQSGKGQTDDSDSDSDSDSDRGSEGGKAAGEAYTPEEDAEFVHVANRIADLLESGQVLSNGRPITPGDIAILIRSKTKLPRLMAALAARGIPTGCDELEAEQAGRDLLHGSDMSYLVNLLRVVDNPDNDVPLSEVLRAPFPGLTLEDLIAIREAGDGSLYTGLSSYPYTPGADPALSARTDAFCRWLEHYRTLSASLPADGILRLLRQDNRVASRSSKAFLYLYDAARTCRVSGFTGVYTFLRFMEKKLQTAKSVSPDPDAHRNAVSVMTVHRSKGLEFPICFLIRCGASLDGAHGPRDLVFDKRCGLGMRLYDRVERRKYTTTLLRAASLAARLHDREDDMRVLYVAMTRARERLYLCGMGKETLPVSFPAGDRFSTLTAGNYLTWICAAWQERPDLAAYADLNLIPASSVTQGPRLNCLPAPDRDDHTQAAAAYYRHLHETAPLPNATESLARSVPTKVPASRMVEHMLDRCVFFSSDLPVGDEDKLPESERGTSGCDPQTVSAIRQSIRMMQSAGHDEFDLLLNQGRKPTPAERGTAAHLFLQFCDFSHVQNAGLDAEIDRLCEQGFINQRTADILNKGQLQAFFDSRFYAQLRTAVQIHREFRFSRFVPLATLTEREDLQTALGDRTLYVQGSVDLLAEMPDGTLLLCDYKTDRIFPGERANPDLLSDRMSEKHGAQLLQYAAAIRETFGREPTQMYIYSVPLGEAVPVRPAHPDTDDI